MIANYSKRKDVYYNNTVYRVPIDDLKHINGIDVVQINEIDIVIWDNDIKKWIKSSDALIEKYKKVTYDKITGNWIL